MSRAAKTLEAMRTNPNGWRIDDLETVAAAFGVTWRKPGGSHVIFWCGGVPNIVSVPAYRPIKPVYVRQFVELVDAAGGSNDH